MSPYAGTFESHVTVRAEGPEQIERFRELCRERGLKCLLIELARGTYHSQPMTATHHEGSFEDVLAEAQAAARFFRDSGLEVTRVKIEADPTSRGVPGTDLEAARLPPTNYFEFHLLVTLARMIELPALGEICEKHNAHLSSNAFKRATAEETQRFVTMRLEGAGLKRASAVFEELARAVEAAGYQTSRQVHEYVVYDSNVSLDAGWMNSPEQGEAT
jgi:hypothetical protein